MPQRSSKALAQIGPFTITAPFFDAELIDGSAIENRVRTMPLAISAQRFSPSSADAPELWEFLPEASLQNSAQLVTFFRIKGAQDGDGNLSLTLA